MNPLQDSCKASLVAVTTDENVSCYPPLDQAPFHPSKSYPEFAGGTISTKPNRVYDMVRRTLADLGLDREHFGSATWNPFGGLIKPGGRVVVKPNWVNDHNMGPGGWECLITHPSILRAVLDYILLAGPSDVLLGDSPIQDCDFERLLDLGVRPVLDYFRQRKAPLRLADFRRTTLQQDGFSLNVREEIRPLDEYVTVDLGSDSLLEPISGDARRFRVTKYDPRKMLENHRPGVHRYLIARDILRADLVVNLPKLKTHKKAGVTASLKNLVGINGNKDYLPHHRKGSAASGHGDCYEKTSPLKAMTEHLLDIANMNLHRSWVTRVCHRLAYYFLVLDMKLGGSGEVEGSWYGNDTIWRTCLDLNRALLYSDDQGILREQPQRCELSMVDALIAGEGDGPLKPDPRPLGTLLASLNPAACDWIAALMMGFYPQNIPIIARSFGLGKYPIALFAPAQLICRLNGSEVRSQQLVHPQGRIFTPPFGWKSHCESKERITT
ncbi:MAG: DUF362 domain-containing protein [Lentisphaerota bacterium]